MQQITKVVRTDLFWETLGELRDTPYYESAIANIKACVANKMANRSHRGASDEPFYAEKALRGIWKCRLSQTPLKILFYTVSGDTINLCKVGDHDDYGWKGKNSKKSESLALHVFNSLKRGNVPFADWKTFRWSDPDRITSHPDLPLMSSAALRRLMQTLDDEYESLEILGREFGGDLNRISTAAAVEWMESLERAKVRINDIIDMRPLLTRAFRDATDADMAFSLPQPTQAAHGMRMC